MSASPKAQAYFDEMGCPVLLQPTQEAVRPKERADARHLLTGLSPAAHRWRSSKRASSTRSPMRGGWRAPPDAVAQDAADNPAQVLSTNA